MVSTLTATVAGRTVKEHITDLTVYGKDNGVRSRTQMQVAHSAETPLKTGYAESVTRNWLNLPGVLASINWFAGIKTMVKSVPRDRAAWHATSANGLSVGYEIVGYAAYSRTQWVTDDGLEAIEREAMQMARDSIAYAIPAVWLNDTQVRAILNGNTEIKGFARHYQIDPVNRSDPGDGFPYDLLMQRVRAHRAVLLGIDVASTVTPTQKEEDPMPSTITNATAKKQVLPKGKWTTLAVNGKGYISVINGNQAQRSINFATITAQGLPKGQELQVRFIVVDYQKGKTTKVWKSFKSSEIIGSGGSTVGQHITPINLPDDSRYRVRLQVISYVPGVDITSVHIDSYIWKQA